MHTLSEAIAAIKAGRRDDAREMLRRILTDDPRNINALLWATEVADSAVQRKYYLNQILAIDPHNIAAHKGLKLLEATGQLSPQAASEKKTDPNPPTLSKVDADNQIQYPTTIYHVENGKVVSQTSEPAESNQPVESTKKCPYCAEVIKADAIVCRFCHRDLTTSVAPLNNEANTPSIGIVVSIIIVALIIVGFLWMDAGSRFFNMMERVLIAEGDPTEARWFVLISFVFAIASWVATRFVTRRRSSTSDKLTLLATLGCIGAVLTSLMVENNSILIAIPLYVVVVYLFNTIKRSA